MARPVLRLVFAVLVLAVLVAGADRAASVAVARSVGQGLQAAQGLPSPPTVAIRGTPFLTQAVRGRFSRVDVGLTGVPAGGSLTVDRLDTRLRGVHADALATLRGDLTALPVDEAEADAFVGFPALERAARQTLSERGVELTLGRAAADRVSFTADLSTPLGRFTVRGQAQLGATGGAVSVRLRPETLDGVPAALRPQVAAQVDLGHLVPPLPFGFQVTSVTVEPTGLRVRAAGNHLTIPV